MDERQYNQIISRLDSILKLLALAAIREKTLKEQVSLLASLGFQPKQMAEMLGKTPNHISVTLHEVRKEKKQQVIQPEGSQVSGPEETLNG